jgi:hypothetical protein
MDVAASPPNDPLALPKVLSEGESAAIARAGEHFFAITLDRGVVGPLVVPDGVVWVGLGAGDRVFAGTSSRQAFTAADVGAAAAGEFSPTAELAGAARAWDAGGAMIAAVTDKGVELSTDAGHSWALAITGVATSIHVRADGVAVAQVLVDGSLVTRVSRDRGTTWTDASYQPGVLSRWGAWILEDNSDCPVVLAADGEHWVAAEELYEVLGGRPYWTDALRARSTVVPFASRGHVTASDPPAPAFRLEVEAVGTKRPCAAPEEEPTGGPPIDEPEPVYPDRPMPRIAGTIGTLAYPSAVELALLTDGVCGDGETVRTNAPRCPHEAPLTRGPHTVLLDRRAGSVTLVDLPEDCWPLRGISAAGLGMVACREGDSARFFAHSGGDWLPEVELPWAEAMSVQMTAAADGTVGLFPSCIDEDCVVHVRRPVGIGVDDAWHRVAIPGAIAYRLMAGGHVLAMSETSDGRVRFQRVDESGSSALLVDEVDVPADTVAVEVVGDRIVLRLESGNTQVLTDLGTLR